MGEKKRIDRIFQEKLKDFEVFPEAHVWKNIEGELMKKKRRRIVPLWLRLGSAAAVLLLLISTGFWFFDQNEPSPNFENELPIERETNETESTEKEDSPETINANQSQNDATTVQESSSSQKDDTNTRIAAPEQNTGALNKSASAQSKVNTSNQTNENINQEQPEQSTSLAKNDTNPEEAVKKENLELVTEQPIKSRDTEIRKENTTVAENQKIDNKDYRLTKNDIAEAIEDQLNEDKTPTNPLKKWSVGTAVAPVYFNSLSKGSPINTSLAANDKEANTSLSYGVKLNYQINDRLSLQSGINNVELAYKTQGVTALIASSELQIVDSNLDTNIDGVNLIAISSNEIATQSSELGAQRGVVNLRGDLNQSLSYIEIPMEAKYALVNRKLGVHLVGGLSTYVLYNNKITILDQNGSTPLGEATNINDINFSGNLGLDVDYKLNNKLFINVAPMFKYQMNTFSKNDGGFKPYYLGVYTGLNFRF